MDEDVNRQILTELRQLRRSSNIGIIVCVMLVAGVAIYLPLQRRSLSTSRQPSWDGVRTAMDHFEYDRAASIAQRIIDRYPSDYYGYAYLGNIALATGRIKEAETHYARAYDLLPTDEHEKMLGAIRKRMATEASKQPPATQ